ncbi:MAG: GNAT family N-acetyltransferase [Chloroflexota bacterium]|nr:GNAT family N-acetyltransferase [Chloroflexota bacterium]
MTSSDRTSISVRQAVNSDVKRISALDTSNSTDYVWQMDLREAESQLKVVFQRTRLPRSVELDFENNSDDFETNLMKHALVLVAESIGGLRGFLIVDKGTAQEAAIITDFAVERTMRRRGIATAMLVTVGEWATRIGLNRLIIVTQSRNYPAICFCRRNGYTYCGYNDSYYTNQDIALFFGMKLR